MSVQIQDHFLSAQDGLRLHAREYGDVASPALPAICLPGLARTAADFEPLALALAGDATAPRRVIAIDSRGRGLSARDETPANYAIPNEMADVFAVSDALGIGPAIVIGTSRGGLIAMAMAAQRPTALKGVVLNDIGPVIETAGLVRIKGYVGKLPAPRDMDEAARLLEQMGKAQFPAKTSADWRRAAALTWTDGPGGPVLAYDPALSKTLESFDPAEPVPAIWPLFEALAGVPVLAIRGTLSDILSDATLAEMAKRHPHLATHVVEAEGHAPWLDDAATIGRIATFVRSCDPAPGH